MTRFVVWLPTLVMGVAGVFTVGVDLQQALPLRQAFATTLPLDIAERVGSDVALPEAQVAVAGVTSYLLRNYEPQDEESANLPFSVYVGYYDSQMRGRTIHSPKNCLPGAGWEALAASRVDLQTDAGTVRVNRYLIQNGRSQALVLYWYQGRKRIESNEYVVKWNLLRDAALRQRSDEALVRVVVPVRGDVEKAFRTAALAAREVIPAVFQALPS